MFVSYCPASIAPGPYLIDALEGGNVAATALKKVIKTGKYLKYNKGKRFSALIHPVLSKMTKLMPIFAD